MRCPPVCFCRIRFSALFSARFFYLAPRVGDPVVSPDPPPPPASIFRRAFLRNRKKPCSGSCRPPPPWPPPKKEVVLQSDRHSWSARFQSKNLSSHYFESVGFHGETACASRTHRALINGLDAMWVWVCNYNSGKVGVVDGVWPELNEGLGRPRPTSSTTAAMATGYCVQRLITPTPWVPSLIPEIPARGRFRPN